jgi:hypothetical protein
MLLAVIRITPPVLARSRLAAEAAGLAGTALSKGSGLVTGSGATGATSPGAELAELAELGDPEEPLHAVRKVRAAAAVKARTVIRERVTSTSGRSHLRRQHRLTRKPHPDGSTNLERFQKPI